MVLSLTQRETEEIRRKALEVLYEADRPIRAKTCRAIMNDLNAATTWDDFLVQIGYLVGEELVRVFPAGSEEELTGRQEGDYLAVCKRTQWDSSEAGRIMLRIRQKGRRFIEGYEPDVRGVARS